MVFDLIRRPVVFRERGAAGRRQQRSRWDREVHLLIVCVAPATPQSQFAPLKCPLELHT